MASRILSPVPAGVAIPKPIFRNGLIRNLRHAGTRFSWDRNGHLKRKKPIKKLSRALRSRLKVYFTLTTEFLLRPENALCLICQVRREHGENILIQPATEVHHFRGRRGRLLCWVPGFRPSCRGCRDFPHDNKKQARELGLLAPAVLYDVFPGDGNA